MTHDQQPEALRLADELEQWAQDYAPTDFTQAMAEKSSAALRRLHAENEQLRAERKPLTVEQAKKIGEEAFRAVLDDLEDNLHVAVVRGTERAHGIGEVA